MVFFIGVQLQRIPILIRHGHIAPAGRTCRHNGNRRPCREGCPGIIGIPSADKADGRIRILVKDCYAVNRSGDLRIICRKGDIRSRHRKCHGSCRGLLRTEGEAAASRICHGPACEGKPFFLQSVYRHGFPCFQGGGRSSGLRCKRASFRNGHTVGFRNDFVICS